MPPALLHHVGQDLNFGRADQALQTLNGVLARNPNDADAHNLRCRVFYDEGEWDKAISDCEAAVALAPNDSNDHLWLARAYGQKANHAGALAGYKLAHRVGAEFQKAVQLDPQNAAALADLGQFDVDAPGIAGGSVAHAENLVPQLQAINPADAFLLKARIAEERKDYAAAEADLKNAIPPSSYPADAWMDLASFYLRRHRFDEMVATAHNGAAADTLHGPALVQGANDLILANREPQTAIRWLRDYLNSRTQSERSPAFVVRAELANLLQNQGDTQAARQELAAVRALASAYRVPALDVSAKAGI
ncbi:MAG TPA: tetratricopeptide repeat protein [Acidobacteriaceae bacterium]|jgi:tetratricopeptide (TPR) repeat protein|nr:tetratricopeptide repeat protein [Acidobacteriaceae bacterium]